MDAALPVWGPISPWLWAAGPSGHRSSDQYQLLPPAGGGQRLQVFAGEQSERRSLCAVRGHRDSERADGLRQEGRPLAAMGAAERRVQQVLLKVWGPPQKGLLDVPPREEEASLREQEELREVAMRPRAQQRWSFSTAEPSAAREASPGWCWLSVQAAEEGPRAVESGRWLSLPPWEPRKLCSGLRECCLRQEKPERWFHAAGSHLRLDGRAG